MRLQLLDICFPDYFRGTSDFCLAVLLTPDMLAEDMESAIKDSVESMMEFPFNYDVFYEVVEEWVTDNHYEMIRNLESFPEDTWTMDDGYYPYAYFSVGSLTD